MLIARLAAQHQVHMDPQTPVNLVEGRRPAHMGNIVSVTRGSQQKWDGVVFEKWVRTKLWLICYKLLFHLPR